MSTQVKSFMFNPFQENTYIVSDQKNNCVIIDPGCYERHEQQELLDYIQENNLKPLAILNTHAHIDHILGNAFLKRHFNIDLYLHEGDLNTMSAVDSYAHVYGFVGYQSSPMPDVILKGDEKLTFGEIDFQVYFTPGHAPGHVVFYNEADKYVINGDVLFKGSFGRTDLPGGDMDILKRSIHTVLFHLPDDTTVYCGHGPSTTIGEEKISNYILNF